MLMAFLGYKGQVLSRVMAVIAFIGDWRMLDLHAERLSDVALSEPENTAINRIRPIRGIITESNSESIANDVIFEAQNLGLRYSDSEPWIFREVDLAIRRGECVAIIGKSGCGKSSLLKAILGLYPATEGRMFAFGHSIKNLRESAFSEQIGVVLQDDCIVYGSVAENVSFHSENVDEGRLVEACKIACIHDDIERMPMRYETVLNESGTGLSGGQRQRILLARALYRRPTVLILDEATSHLDSATEARINHALDAASLTRLIIAHRPQTISSASRVLTLSEIGLQNYRTD
jgi:ATP-binding cassette subfamily B protein RaxB